MILDSEADESGDAPAEMAQERPRLAQWLWRPWYARLWWLGIVVYWSGKVASLLNPAMASFYEGALAGYLNIAFFPLAALLVLGLGYVGAWMDFYRCEWVSIPREETAPRRSVGGWQDPCSDPLDPRSGTLWIGSPEQTAKRFHHH